MKLFDSNKTTHNRFSISKLWKRKSKYKEFGSGEDLVYPGSGERIEVQDSTPLYQDDVIACDNREELVEETVIDWDTAVVGDGHIRCRCSDNHKSTDITVCNFCHGDKKLETKKKRKLKKAKKRVWKAWKSSWKYMKAGLVFYVTPAANSFNVNNVTNPTSFFCGGGGGGVGKL